MSTPNNGINGSLGIGLLAHWGFADGFIDDESGNAVVLNKVGNPNMCIDIDGITNAAYDVLNVANHFYCSNMFSGDFSISFIFKISAFNKTIFAIADSATATNPMITLDVNSSGMLLIWQNGGVTYSLKTININQNYHFIITRQNLNTIVYLDNILLTNRSTGIGSSANIYFGTGTKKTGTSGIDEIRLYNRKLTNTNLVVGNIPNLEVLEIFEMGANYSLVATPIVNLTSGTYYGTQILNATCSTPNSYITIMINWGEPILSDTWQFSAGTYEVRVLGHLNGSQSDPVDILIEILPLPPISLYSNFEIALNYLINSSNEEIEFINNIKSKLYYQFSDNKTTIKTQDDDFLYNGFYYKSLNFIENISINEKKLNKEIIDKSNIPILIPYKTQNTISFDYLLNDSNESNIFIENEDLKFDIIRVVENIETQEYNGCLLSKDYNFSQENGNKNKITLTIDNIIKRTPIADLYNVKFK